MEEIDKFNYNFERISKMLKLLDIIIRDVEVELDKALSKGEVDE